MFALGVCLGVMLTLTFGLVVAAIDDTRVYRVVGSDDHTVKIQAGDGPVIELQMENVPDVSCFETGSTIIIDYRP